MVHRNWRYNKLIPAFLACEARTFSLRLEGYLNPETWPTCLLTKSSVVKKNHSIKSSHISIPITDEIYYEVGVDVYWPRSKSKCSKQPRRHSQPLVGQGSCTVSDSRAEDNLGPYRYQHLFRKSTLRHRLPTMYQWYSSSQPPEI